ncbi:MAG: right-handed parallel beta-helix repeat-containing protein [Sandaracinaceae bacterium]|nr:right-handed parallel beta-helix repeat-containing protein [Sandaracinaceae bacterium]
MHARHALTLGTLTALTLVGCDASSSNDDGGTTSRDDAANASLDAARSDAGAWMGGDPTSGCEGRLEPAAPSGHLATVGDGTAASCTEDALHAAVAEVDAAGGGTVRFDCGGAHTITLSRSVFVEGPAMLLDGGGEITLSGGGAVRVIELDHSVDFVLQRITIRDGFVPAGAENESGAGLLSPWFGTLRVIDATFEHNVSASQDHDVGGGAIYAGGLTEAVLSGVTFSHNSGSTGGAVLSRSTNLRVIDSVFFANAATSEGEGQYGNGGGLYIDRMWLDAPVDFEICGSVFEANHARVHGSAFFSYNLEGTRAVFDRCTFRDNDMDGSVGGTGTVYHEGVPLVLSRSTFSGNRTTAHGGGLFLGGGTNAEVRDCTFQGNTTPGNAGALWAGNGQVEVSHTTFADNAADYGPVIFQGSSGHVRLTDTIFANNRTDNAFSALACHETFEDGGGNVQWPATKNNGNADTPCAAGVLFADPRLGPLADHGGPTHTMALSVGSAALGHAVVCEGWDQRGTPRSAPCDSGAYEDAP